MPKGSRSAELHALIDTRVIDRNFSKDPHTQKSEAHGGWIFDFRAIILDPAYLTLLVDELWGQISQYDNIQIGGLESASIPIVTALVLKATQEGRNVNGFYIRKSRKKSGYYRQIEGNLNDNPIILVDDLMNSSHTFMRQVEVLEKVGRKVFLSLAVVRFREISRYTHLTEKGITIKSLYTLSDFNLQLLESQKSNVLQNPYRTLWAFSPGVASYRHVCPRSTPVVDNEKIYFGTDRGLFWALDKKTGNAVWSFKTGLHAQQKNIFSSPLLYEGKVLFGSYDGKFYALDAKTGKCIWAYTDCEWIGSSPAAADDLNMIFVGLEHGHPNRKGSIVGLRSTDGEKVWEFDMQALTHASPLYIQQYRQVAIGGNEGSLYLLDAHTGNLLWRFETEGGQKYPGTGGFSPGDIKLAPIYDTVTDTIAFTSMDGHLYVVQRSNGALVFRAHTDYYDTDVHSGIYGAPLIYGDMILFAGLDKHLYCLDKRSGHLHWKFATSGRVFASPATRDGHSVFIGSNDGRLYELELTSGKLLTVTQFSERITNPVVFDPTDPVMYVVMQTNDVCALTTEAHKTNVEI